jgi:hypothetical protein
MPMSPAPGLRHPVLGQRHEIMPRNTNAAGRCPLQAGHDHQHRRFAGARRADDGKRRARSNVEIYALQNVDGTGPAIERQAHIAKADDRHPIRAGPGCV